MAGAGVPATDGRVPPADADLPQCVAGSAPGPLRDSAPPAAPQLRVPRFTTPAGLLALARRVLLQPAPDRAVFYAEDQGAALARAFIAGHPGHTRLDELLAQTAEGRQLAAALADTRRPWSDKEEVWWELSYRLARAAAGTVHVFGPERLVGDRPLEEHRHARQRNAFAHTVFEKVEWPELEQNPAVTQVFYNGRPYNG